MRRSATWLRDGLLQVVDVVGEDAVELAHLRRNVAGDGDVDEEHRAILAAGEELLSVFAAEDGVRRAGRGDDDVGAVAGVVQVLELDGLAVELLRQADGAIVGAVGDEDRGAAVGHQVAGGEFAHLAGADDEDRLPFQRAENLFGEFDRDRGDRHRRRSDGGLGAHALGDGEGAAEELVELSANGAYGAGGGVGLFDLAENLGFADDHGIQARSHAEEMADGVFLAEFVEVRVEFFGGQMEVVVQESAQVGVAVGGVGHDLHAIAGGDDHALFDPGIGVEIAAGIGQARLRDRQALAHFERRALVIHANELESHEAANLWIAEK